MWYILFLLFYNTSSVHWPRSLLAYASPIKIVMKSNFKKSKWKPWNQWFFSFSGITRRLDFVQSPASGDNRETGADYWSEGWIFYCQGEREISQDGLCCLRILLFPWSDFLPLSISYDATRIICSLPITNKGLRYNSWQVECPEVDVQLAEHPMAEGIEEVCEKVEPRWRLPF